MKRHLRTGARIAVMIAGAWALAGCAPSSPAPAAGAATGQAEVDSFSPGLARLREALRAADPQLPVHTVRPSGLAGLYELRDGLRISYVTPDGRFLIHGDVVEISGGVNHSEIQRAAERRLRLESLEAGDMIVFAPQAAARHRVTVFTDPECSFCRSLHAQRDAYLALGIAIHYVAFPRGGPESPGFRAAQAIWCAKDPRDALTRAMLDQPIEPAGGEVCARAVTRGWELGNEFRLSGTPLLVLEDGTVVTGHVKPAALARMLGQRPGN